MTPSTAPKNAVADIAERVVATFVEAAIPILVGLKTLDVSAVRQALIVGGIAVLALAKNVATAFLKRSGSPSLAPAVEVAPLTNLAAARPIINLDRLDELASEQIGTVPAVPAPSVHISANDYVDGINIHVEGSNPRSVAEALAAVRTASAELEQHANGSTVEIGGLTISVTGAGQDPNHASRVIDAAVAAARPADAGESLEVGGDHPTPAPAAAAKKAARPAKKAPPK